MGTGIVIRPSGPDKEFTDLFVRCCKEKPDKTDLRELRKRLELQPELYKSAFDLAEVTQQAITNGLFTEDQKTLKIALGAQITHMKQELGYDHSPMLERLLIENIATCWMRQQWVEYQVAGFMGEDGATFKQLEFWERRLSLTQQRYLRACETLAKIRKLKLPALQVNIASEGGQQVNISGDLVRK
jgi:hypothetical protein